MMSKLKLISTSEHRGMGGLYFIMTSIICAMIMVISLRLSWMSQAVAMADNLAYMVSINVSVHSHISNVGSFSGTNPTIPVRSTGTNYSPLSDFNDMLASSRLATSGSGSVYVTWNGRSATVQFDSFKTTVGAWVKPHRQESVIENN